MKKLPLSIRDMHIFVLLKTGKKVQIGESPIFLTADALIAEGKIDDGIQGSMKKRVYAQAAYVKAQIKDHQNLLKPRPAKRAKEQPVVALIAPGDGVYFTSRLVYRGDVTSDAFLKSFEWRAVRMQALKRYGRKCACCGASPSTGAVMNVDHIKPRKHYPALALDLENLQVLCGECNHGKGNWDMTDWREKSA